MTDFKDGQVDTISIKEATSRGPLADKDGDGFIWQEVVNVFKENEEVCSEMITGFGKQPQDNKGKVGTEFGGCTIS